MSTKQDNFEKELKKLRPFLGEYLSEFGIRFKENTKIKCINPAHDDRSPSMQCYSSDDDHPHLHCFSCGFHADIFRAAHVLEHKPAAGPGFVMDNVMYLANKFGVEVYVKEMSEADIYEYQTYQAYAEAARYISGSPFSEMVMKELEYRGWDEQFIRRYMIGSVDSLANMRGYLKQLGFSAKFLDSIDLNNSRLFRPENLIFTICDHYGRPVGFSARNLKYDGNKGENGPKFINTTVNSSGSTDTEPSCNIFRKHERLYLLDKAIKSGKTMWVVEGYGDAVTAHQHGGNEFVALGGLSFTEHHLNAIRRQGINNINVCLDSDKAGIDMAKSLLDEVLVNVRDMSIRFVFIPEEIDEEGNVLKIDPDIFIRNNGIEALYAIEKIHPFEWRLREFDKQESPLDGEVICKIMLPVIQGEPSHITRESMIRSLSEYTGYPEASIRADLRTLEDSDEARIASMKRAVMDDLIAKLKKGSQSFDMMLVTAQGELNRIDNENKGNVFDSRYQSTMLREIQEYQNSPSMYSAVNFGPNFRTLGAAFRGDLKGKLIWLGGGANTGKTTTFANLIWDLVQYSSDTVYPVMMSLDDSSRDFVSRLVTYDMACRLYENDLNLFNVLETNIVSTPDLFRHLPEFSLLEHQRSISYQEVSKAMGEGRFAIVDSTNGGSMDFINYTFRKLKEMYPNKHIVMFVDNFHLIAMSDGGEGREKFKEMSKTLKNLCKLYDATVFSTVEYTKLPPGVKPTNNNIAESVQMEYDGNAIIHLYNELHGLPDTTNAFFYDDFGRKMPLIEANFGKNKISAFKGTAYYKFWPGKGFYREITQREFNDEVQMHSNERVAAKMEEQSGGDGYANHSPLNRFTA